MLGFLFTRRVVHLGFPELPLVLVDDALLDGLVHLVDCQHRRVLDVVAEDSCTFEQSCLCVLPTYDAFPELPGLQCWKLALVDPCDLVAGFHLQDLPNTCWQGKSPL